MLQIENLEFSYHKKKAPIFNGISLTIQPGSVYGLLGKNGIGKSTLLYMMCGLMFPHKGHITLDGVEVRHRRPETLEKIFLVPEEFDLPPISVDAYVRRNSVFYPRFDREQFDRYLADFELENVKNLSKTSMGQKKKYLVSFALATNTPLLFMDEPTNGMDIPSKSQFRKAIALGMSDERSIVISTHQVRDLESMIDRVLILHNHSMLLNESTLRIAERLEFVNTTDKEELDGCIYSAFTPAGFVGVRPNTTGAETPVDLEVLFNAIITNPETITNQFV